MKQKINIRLAIIALIAVAATAVGITLVNYNLFQQQVRTDLRVETELLRDTGLFQAFYEEEGSIPDTNIFDEMQVENLRITWIDSDGSVLYDNDTDASGLENHLDRPEIADALTKGYGESIRKSSTMHMNTYYYALLLENGTILRISTQAHTIFTVFFTVLPVILIICAVILLICILIGHMLTTQLLKPINQVAEHLDDHSGIIIYKELQPFADKIRSQHENILSAAKSRQDFTANVSHELKTPLTAISGYAELIENHMVGPEQEVHIAQEIHSNADRLLSLINDIIRLSELDHSDSPGQFGLIDLYELALECCADLQINAGQHKISLTCSGRPATFRADREMLRELIENLVQNAIRYNHEGGYVRVTVYPDGNRCRLTVKDNGIGIPKDKQSRVFERFYRVDKSRSKETGGTGLGLAIVKHIAELHSAEISLTSEPGHGTQIDLLF